LPSRAEGFPAETSRFRIGPLNSNASNLQLLFLFRSLHHVNSPSGTRKPLPASSRPFPLLFRRVCIIFSATLAETAFPSKLLRFLCSISPFLPSRLTLFSMAVRPGVPTLNFAQAFPFPGGFFPSRSLYFWHSSPPPFACFSRTNNPSANESLQLFQMSPFHPIKTDMNFPKKGFFFNLAAPPSDWERIEKDLTKLKAPRIASRFQLS